MSARFLTLVFASAVLAGAEDLASCLDGDCGSEEAGDRASLLSIKTKVTTASAVQQVQLKSQTLANEIAEMAKTQPEGSVSQQFLQTFQVCGQCNNFQRFGEAADGGYLMCMDGLNKDKMTAAYSLGVEHHDQWSEDVIKNLGLSVNQFDCTVHSSECSANHPDSCKFFKKCIVSSDGKHPLQGHESEGWTLNQVLAETNQANAPDNSLLMKMDIEASEWPIFPTETPETLKKFGELIVEFHWLSQEQNHPQYLQAMQHILKSGFKVAHLHGNNFGGMYQKDGKSIPDVVEVTFVHSAARPGGCATTQLYDDKLDAPNNPTNVELPMAKMA